MTAKELYECVKLWPAEARPACVTGWIRGCYVEVRAAEQGDKPHCVHAWMLPDDAIALHVASGLEWLVTYGHEPALDYGALGIFDDGTIEVDLWTVHATNDSGEKAEYVGHTLFHAIHKAILATKENA